MKVVLLSPPGLAPFTPPLSIMALSSYLRQEGIEAATIDTSIEFLHFNLFPERLKDKIQAAKAVFASLGPEFSYPEQEEITKINNRIDRDFAVVQEVWGEEGFNISKDNFETAAAAINNALLFTSLVNLPTIHTLNCLYASESMLRNKSENPFLEYYQKKLIPRIAEFQPDLIGISYSYESQLFPGLSLTAEIRNALKVPVVCGGSFFSIMCDAVYKDGTGSVSTKKEQEEDLLGLLHPFGIYGEGEEPLLALCKCMEKNGQYRHVPRLLYYDKKLEALKVNHHSKTIEAGKLPLIDLKDLPVGKKYLTPLVFAPLMSARGCYWNKCAFCVLAESIGSNWRRLPQEKIIQNIKLYKEHYGVDFIVFTDEAMPPVTLRFLAERILQEGIEIYFGTMMRFEKGLLHTIELAAKAGCRFLSFGFESGCRRIVSAMRKGYSHETAQHILDQCAENGIAVELHVMFGFPTETVDEARETISFLEKNSDKIAVISANPWVLAVGSHIYDHLEHYGIVPNEGRVIADDPSTYSVTEGIGYKQALEMVNSLYGNPLLGKKILRRMGVHGFSEEYYYLQRHFPEALASPLAMARNPGAEGNHA
ncbi:MAG: Ribosomal protein S12 methylthiotransferase RimO [Pelotomaculum sp. PtaB.Bin104]|nr:MAG: Ribosomal protein S12 methylthiotransferase RimO [Pelotomaculum sp. PtaB.Bin104]